MKPTLQTIGNWNSEIGVPLKRAISTTMGVMNRTAENTTRQAIILMAQSARAMTPQAPKNRKIMTSEKGQKYVETYTKRTGSTPLRIYLPSRRKQPAEYASAIASVRPIHLRTLAKASWFWALNKVGKKTSGDGKLKDKFNSVRGGKIKSQTAVGYWIENRLGYITKILPANWAAEVERKAGNRMMAQAEKKLERDFKRQMDKANNTVRA